MKCVRQFSLPIPSRKRREDVQRQIKDLTRNDHVSYVLFFVSFFRETFHSVTLIKKH